MKSMAWKSKRWYEGLFADTWQKGFSLHSGSTAWKEMLRAFFERSARMVKRNQEESTDDERTSFAEAL